VSLVVSSVISITLKIKVQHLVYLLYMASVLLNSTPGSEEDLIHH